MQKSSYIKLLKLKDFPYILTLLLSLFGWTINKIVDRISASPTIEYSVGKSEKLEGQNFCMLVKLVNLSDTKSFSNFNFKINTEKNDSVFTGWKLYSVAPELYKNVYSEFAEPRNYMLTEQVDRMNPGAEYMLEIHSRSKDCKPLIRLGMIPDADDQPLILKEANVYTAIAKNELEIYTAALILWIVFIVMFVVHLKHEI